MRLPGQVPAADDGGVPPVGPSGWFTVLWVLDETVGLPPPDPAGEYPEHTAVARKFLQRLARGDVAAARRLVDTDVRPRLSEGELRRRWENAVRRLGAVPPIDDDQRWSTLRRPPGAASHTAPGARCRLTFLLEHERGRTRHVLDLVRGEHGPAITGYELTELRPR